MSNPRAKLNEEQESLLHLAMSGGRFVSYAATQLTHDIPYEECRFDILRSCLARHDIEQARVFINDWTSSKYKTKVNVSKFVPGDHYHVLGTKFDTLEQAIAHIRSQGHEYGRLIEKFVYRDGE